MITCHRILLPLLIALAAGAQISAQTASSKTKSVVPFVGCKADGQAGPLDAPTGQPKAFPIPSALAQRLAYYKAEQGPGVLAPRGWQCFCTYGSSGGSLFVAPQKIDPALLFSDSWKGFTGPVVQFSVSIGDTSGRFSVARVIARVFPAHKEFVKAAIEENIMPASDFPSGPYPKDKLTYKNKEMVEFETLAMSEGLGTMSRLLPNSNSIHGVRILSGDTPDLTSLTMRLPASDNDLTSVIIQQTELEAASPKP